MESNFEAFYLLPHFPHMLHIAEQVAAPQQLAANPMTCLNGLAPPLDTVSQEKTGSPFPYWAQPVRG